MNVKTHTQAHGEETSCVFLHDISQYKYRNSVYRHTKLKVGKLASSQIQEMLRSFVGKIEKGLTLIVPRKPTPSYLNENDVRKGYFAVLASKDGESKRFVVELDYLTNPAFLGLLDQAGEEYGFRQKGTLALPCRPQELQNILDAWRTRSDNIKGAGGDFYFPKFL
ncbi:Auxin-responsive protein SAUR32, partial [Mucuna pruriens]